jgi:hypothetical protein
MEIQNAADFLDPRKSNVTPLTITSENSARALKTIRNNWTILTPHIPKLGFLELRQLLFSY